MARLASTFHNVLTIGNDQMANARKPSAPALPVIDSGEPGLALLDATKTGAKAKDLETKLHRLVIGQEEAIHEIVRTYQTYLAGLSPEGRPWRALEPSSRDPG